MGTDFSRFLMKGVHAVVMVVEAEPPSGHVAGEAGGVIGAETALFRQRLRGIAAGVLQQQIPEPPERVGIVRFSVHFCMKAAWEPLEVTPLSQPSIPILFRVPDGLNVLCRNRACGVRNTKANWAFDKRLFSDKAFICLLNSVPIGHIPFHLHM